MSFSSSSKISASRSSKNIFSQVPCFKELPESYAPQKRPFISSLPNAATTFTVDVSWTARSIVPLPAVPDHALGFPTIGNLPIGLLGAYNASSRARGASQRDDNGALLEATVDGTVYGLQALFGLDYTGVRTLAVATSFSPHLSRLSLALGILVSVGNYLFGALFFAIGVLGIVQAVRASRFHAEYKRIHPNKDEFSTLVECLLVPKQEIGETITQDKATLHILGLHALEGTGLSPIVLNGEYTRATPDRRNQLLNTILKNYFASRPELVVLKEFYFPQVERALTTLTFTESLGLLLKLEKMQATREARATSAIGNQCVQKIKKAAVRGLEARLSNTSPEYRDRVFGTSRPFTPDVYEKAIRENHALLFEVESSYARHQRQNFGLLFIGVLGTVISILSCVLLGPTGVTALFWLNLITAVSSALVDATYVNDALESAPGLHDKKIILAYALLASIGIALSIASLVLLGTSPFLAGFTAGLGTTMLGLYAAAYYKTHKKELQWKQDHPTLADLGEYLQTGDQNKKLSERALTCFKKLPKALRNTLTDRAMRRNFRNTTYAQWDTTGHFSRNFLRSYFAQSEPFENIEIEQLYRAVKKTAAFCWSQWWYSNKNEHFKQQALLLEQLLESIAYDLTLRQDLASETAHTARNIELRKTARISLQKARYLYKIQHSDIRLKLHENILRIFKREESMFDLREITKPALATERVENLVASR